MDFIGLLIFLYIVYRSAKDKQRGKERTSPRRRVARKMEQPAGMPYLQEEQSPSLEKRKGDTELESLEEILGKFLGVEEFLAEERSSKQELRSEPTEQVTRVEQTDRVKQVKPVVPIRRAKKIDRKSYTKSNPVAVNREPQIANAKGSMFTGVDLKQAVIWSEILQKPKALRRRNMSYTF